MELLAPVGYKDALKAAVLGGADAVYMAGKDFGARRLADNFSDEELKGAVKFAHDNKVRVYITVNTLIKESELDSAAEFINFLHSIDVDAVIVQDRGLMRYIRENTAMAVHASTQMGIHSLEGARWAQEQGLQRVILSRELNLEQIRKIKEGSSIGLEVFIHGALCYSFSGGCLFSSMLGGRSGNRGLCAQPCRKSYRLGDQKGFLLSTADTFGVDSVPELMRIGVESLKIEGRMRSPQYVYLTSMVYSNVIRRAKEGRKEIITPRERELLETVFNRGFSRGYLKDSEVVQPLFADSRGLPLGKAVSEGHQITVLSDRIFVGDGLTFYRGDEKVGGFLAREMTRKGKATILRSPFYLAKGEYRAYKTKDREFDDIQAKIGSIDFGPMKVIRTPVHIDLPKVNRGSRKPQLSFYVSSASVMDVVLPYAERVYYEMGRHWEDAREVCRSAGIEFVLILPRISPEIPDIDADSIMVSTLGQMYKYRNRRLYTHYTLNYFNSLTVPKVYQQTLSVELSRNDISDICSHTDERLEAYVFGRVELMVSKDPRLREGTLIDERNKRFQTYRDAQGYVHILNSSDTFLLDYLDELEALGIDSFGIDLRRRHPDLAKLVAEAYVKRDLSMKSTIRKKTGGLTASHFENGVP
ncbi:MAG: U32 family peptidase [Methanomassiliicoccales archaeon]|nr:MAG: U32 family peptidase [Methanomassiliicoccales archaeon]